MGVWGSTVGVALVSSWWLAGLWELSRSSWSTASSSVGQPQAPAPTVVQFSPSAPSECHCHCNVSAERSVKPPEVVAWGACALALVAAQAVVALALCGLSCVRRAAGGRRTRAERPQAAITDDDDDTPAAARAGKKSTRGPLGYLAVDPREL